MAEPNECIFELLDTIGPQVHRLLVRLTLSEHVAEDLMQDLFVKLLAKPNFRIKNAPAYLRRAAINSAFDWRRRRDIRKHESPPDVTVANAIDVGKEIEKREEVERVLQALEALPEIQRDIIVLRYFDDESFERIGELCGKSSHQVRSMLHKGITSLRTKLNARTRRV